MAAIIGFATLCFVITAIGVGIAKLIELLNRKSIHDRADEGSNADCYLIAVLKGAASGANFAGGRGTVEAARSIKHTHSTHPDIARPGDGTGL